MSRKACLQLRIRCANMLRQLLRRLVPLPKDPSNVGGSADSLSNMQTLSSAEGVPDSIRRHGWPEKIGHYRLVRVLGEGGMGTVFEAEQEQPRRRVALKVIRASWAHAQLLERFERESHALGLLHHSGIAQIYEAGSAETGAGLQPFFAMELIHGQPLTEYARTHKLGIRQRLALVIQVCEAVQHAHQRGIIHRDLKPGNILVDQMGQAKILDFGLARLTNSDAEATRQTDVGQILGTLAYMSPEQILADPTVLDTRSDVYAVGVMLYELLAEKLPYTISRQVHEAMRSIQESDPAPLSSMNRLYRGDIETIVGKALEKEKDRRYASAADLAADIRRYLEDQPITARPASTAYQLRKFAKRHKALVTGIAAVFVVLVTGVVASSWEAVRARKAERKAQQESEIAQAVNDFLRRDLLAQASAYNQSKPDPDLKVRTAVDLAAQNISGKFDHQPEVEAAIRGTIGTTYMGLGLYSQSREQLERALELNQKVLGPANQKTIETMLELANTEEAQGKFPEAESVAKKALDLSRPSLGPEHRDTLRIMERLVSIDDELGKFSEGEALGVQALNISRRINGPDSLETANCMYFLAIMYYEQGKTAESQFLNQQAVDIRRRLLGADHPDTLNAMNNLATTYTQGRNYSEAEALNKELIERRGRVLGPDHPDTLDAMVNLAFDYGKEKKYADAQALDEQTLRAQRRVLGPEHPLTLRSMHNLGNDLRAQGHLAEAEAIDRQTLEIRGRVLGPESPDTFWSMSSLASDNYMAGKYQQAAELDTKVAELRSRVLGAQNPRALSSWTRVAADYQALHDYPKAESAYRTLCKNAPDNPAMLNELAWFLLTVPDKKLRRPAEALDLSHQSVKLAAQNAGNEYNTLGLALVRNSLWEEAFTTLNKSVEFNKGQEPTDFFLLAIVYQVRGAKPDAEQNFTRGVDVARKLRRQDPDTIEIWADAAKSLSKPAPAVPPTK